jgi:cell division protein FtsW
VTGIPLPFISDGGTSLILTCAVLGMLVSFARHEPAAVQAARRASAAGTSARWVRALRLGNPQPPAPSRSRRPAEQERSARADARTTRADARTGRADARTGRADTRTSRADTRTGRASARTGRADAETARGGRTRMGQPGSRSPKAGPAGSGSYRRGA